jgi:hypothetical protein
MKVWKYQPRISTGGAPAVYGEKYYLHAQSSYRTYKHPKTKLPCKVFQRSIFELDPGEKQQFDAHTTKGRKLTITVWRWDNMMIRSKNGNNMKDKPFDLLAVQVCDAQTGERIFHREMFIAVCGERKTEISTSLGYKFYRHRYDIEPYLRFAKQRLVLEDFQTPDVEHFDNWLLIVQWQAGCCMLPPMKPISVPENGSNICQRTKKLKMLRDYLLPKLEKPPKHFF